MLICFNCSSTKHSHICVTCFSSQQLNHLVPRSHKFQIHCSQFMVNRDYGLQRELPTTGFDIAQSRRIPKWIIASSLAISKQSTPFTHCEHRNSDRLVKDLLIPRLKIYSKSAWSVWLQKCIIDSVQDKPVSPLCSKLKAYSSRIKKSTFQPPGIHFPPSYPEQNNTMQTLLATWYWALLGLVLQVHSSFPIRQESIQTVTCSCSRTKIGSCSLRY
jgi:hypothetical protein